MTTRYSKQAQLHTEMAGGQLSEGEGTFMLWIERGSDNPQGYDVLHELQQAEDFASQLSNPVITVTIHVQGDQD